MRIIGNFSVKLILIVIAALIISANANAEIENSNLELSCTLPLGQPDVINVYWSCDYTGIEPLNLQLFRILPGDSLQPVPGITGSMREYSDHFNAYSRPVGYRLITMVNDTLSNEINATVPTMMTGGFTAFTARDVPHDAGGEIILEWECAEMVPSTSTIEVYKSVGEVKTCEMIGKAAVLDSSFEVDGVEDGKLYNFMLRALNNDFVFESTPVMDVSSQAAWFDSRKVNLLIIAVVLMAAVIIYVVKSRRGAPLFIRKIAGLNAVEEAVGRATEMGRSVLFVPGIQDLDDVQTIAGLTILGSVAKLTAQYETGLDVPTARSLVMSNGREIVKESYLSVGRPDFYNDDMVHYVTDEQFGYVAAVDGIMVREKPAACFYMGAFFAESLILAETGNSVGAIQIAGTAMPTQLPFFVAACDYTLIGEELFAASAYLSGDQRAIGSLRGQDVGKAISMFAILAGSIIITIASLTGSGTEGVEPGFWGKLADGFTRLFALNY